MKWMIGRGAWVGAAKLHERISIDDSKSVSLKG